MEKVLLPLLALYGILVLVNFYFSVKASGLKRKLYREMYSARASPAELHLSFHILDQDAVAPKSLQAIPGAIWPSLLPLVLSHEQQIASINRVLVIVRWCRMSMFCLFATIIAFTILKTT